jgi:[ribulose-bisphosphate carboxylase]/[fructose-bisphosphate aldolase]-lysine N-methyltransferase
MNNHHQPRHLSHRTVGLEYYTTTARRTTCTSKQKSTLNPYPPFLISLRRSKSTSSSLLLSSSSTADDSLSAVSNHLDAAFQGAIKELSIKTCNVRVAPSSSISTHRLGLVATKSISKGEVLLAMPYDDDDGSTYMLTPNLARQTVFQDVLPESYDAWTGDYGLLALLVLNELARSCTSSTENDDTNNKMLGTALPRRSPAVTAFMSTWVQQALPKVEEMRQYHPLLWSEEDQEVLQSSTTNKIYRQLDDIEEDYTWLVKNVFDKDRTKRFPEYVTVQLPDSGSSSDAATAAAAAAASTKTMPCFSLEGMKWAMAIAKSRSFFLDGSLRLIPLLDMCNHQDDANEVQAGSMGTFFGTTKGAKLVADKSYQAGEEVFCSYGPKSAADYLLEHGFVPESCWDTAVAEVTFELDAENDRFYDDKLDILEFETYSNEPMDPVQSFDIVAAPGRGGDPDPAMIQFVRLCKLGGTDAFLLESIFRKEVWGFMELPVSEQNELAVVNAIAETCQRALDDFTACPKSASQNNNNISNNDDKAGSSDSLSSPAKLCARLRESESKALTRMLEFLQREKEALDLKEYYQERRLKDLGLDSDWSPEEDVDSELGVFGQKRMPGGADYDW